MKTINNKNKRRIILKNKTETKSTNEQTNGSINRQRNKLPLYKRSP